MAYKIVETKKNLETQVQNVMDEKTRSDNPAEHATIFHLILDAKGPPPERSLHRLGQEALSLVAAGSLTTAHALRTTTYHLLANPPILQTLLAELDDAIPGLAQPPPLQQLEKLPYLSAVITEGLRIGYGIVHRLERSFPDRALIYGPYTIPPNTPVSMSTVLVHDNPDIFPSPRTFNPDRWLQSKDKIVDSEDGHHHRLDKFLLTFSRGTRGCVGLNLAYAELYLTLANVFRRFQLELYEVVRERDVDLHHDFFNPCESLQSKGLRARVVGMRA
ncbi:hypothetical protein MMC16_000768 [Acarospora aff. strigata]|nr:hypothetical protein [Acarospora aff. strigata]